MRSAGPPLSPLRGYISILLVILVSTYVGPPGGTVAWQILNVGPVIGLLLGCSPMCLPLVWESTGAYSAICMLLFPFY